MTEIMLYPVIVIEHEEDRDRALRVLMKAENACLITSSIKARVSVQAVVRIE